MTTGTRFKPRGLRRWVSYGVLWLILCEGENNDIWFGFIAVTSAILVQSHMFAAPQPPTWRIGNFLSFIPHFVSASVRGAVDVAVRALNPTLPVNPGIIEVEIRTTQPEPLVFLLAVIGLFPGSVCVDYKTNRIYVHALDRERASIATDIRQFEAYVALLYGEDSGKKL